MTARERHGLTERSIDSIRASTASAYRLLYADGSTPEPLRRRLEARAGAGDLEIVTVDPELWPNQIRRALIGSIDTEYVVFIDNDVVVAPGWLEALVACADETGAGVVGPLYLIGGGAMPTSVHMAGGGIEWTDGPGGRALRDWHEAVGGDPERVAAEAVRARCGYVEFHCVLVRTAAARDGAPFDPDICCMHEHIDLSLTMRERGFDTWIEPRARVTYLAGEPWSIAELGFRRWRWAREAGEASLAAFARKWRVVDEGRSFGSARTFLSNHTRWIDPLRPEWLRRADLDVPMRADELVQTRSALLDLAQARGYPDGDCVRIAQVCDLAAVLMNGSYRPCGRPFVAHLIGTAGVLVRYGFRLEVVLAGLLHAAYTHCPRLPPGPKSSIEAVCDALGGRGSPLERRVRAYSRRGEDLRSLASFAGRLDALRVDDAEIVAMAAANDVDMELGGEYRYTGRKRLDEGAMALIRQVAAALGVEGLAATLEAARATAVAPQALRAQMQISYRIEGLRYSPILNDVFPAFDRATRDP
jgi:GT2 family glycosyltransferase